MIDKTQEAHILRLYYAEKWKVGTISQQLHVHKSVVRRVIAQEGSIHALVTRSRKVDPFLPFITETLEKYPTLTASRLFCMVKSRGYSGQISQFRAVMTELRRPRTHEPFFRLKTIPGEQAQVDWAHFGRLTIGKASRPLVAFVIVLSYSRAIFLRFFLSQNLSHFILGHELAFRWFGGVARVCLYDNLKSVVVERIGAAIRFNSQFTEYAGHCRFEPRPVAVARGNEKGRTERAIRYIRSHFFAARKFNDLEDLNRQALDWCRVHALMRRWPEDTSCTVEEVFLEEQKALLPLPDNAYPCEERREASVGKTPYIRFDLNDYSVPAAYVQRAVTVAASVDTVRILDGMSVLAVHQRSYDRGQTIEDEQHLDDLKRIKAAAAQHRQTYRLAEVVPSSKELLALVAERNQPLHQASEALHDLLRTYGPERLETAINEALTSGVPHPHAVRLILERMRRETGKTAALPLPLSDAARQKIRPVKPASLFAYKRLVNTNKGDNNDDNN